MKFELENAFDTFYNNIDKEKENYEQDKLHYLYSNSDCYKEGFRRIQNIIENYYNDRYKCKWIYEQLHGRVGKTIEPYIMLKKEDKILTDGIYLYLRLSNDSNNRYIYLSLELGKSGRYKEKDETYRHNCMKIRNYYINIFNQISREIFDFGNAQLSNDEYSIINYKIYDIENIISYIAILAKAYDRIIEDIKKYNYDDKVWENNWEIYQKNLFQENYIMKEITPEDGDQQNENDCKLDNVVAGAYNMIYYGVPGCGKSFEVDSKFNKEEYIVYTTTFYPDYSNSDFVGQIIPKIKNEQVYYKFQEGPFSKALLDAYKNSDKKVCLKIEEINRGNASAIFGDIFQLLDRKPDGTSRYEIDNYLISDYLKKEGLKNVEKIKIPSNLWIIGTMNTSDQNVYTLDTAFKRRWKMKRISNIFSNSKYDRTLANMKIPGSNYTWEQFVDKINKAILLNNPGGLNGEDKQIGIYFVSLDEFETELNNDSDNAKEYFAEKVLMYIWDDIAKIDPDMWFDKDYQSFDELEEAFKEKGLEIFNNIFSDNKKITGDISDE